MELFNKDGDAGVAGATEDIRYPGVGRMLLIWSAIGALTVARYQLPFGGPGPSRETLAGLVACQFTREYSRLFGQPPMRNVKAIRSPGAPPIESVNSRQNAI